MYNYDIAQALANKHTSATQKDEPHMGYLSCTAASPMLVLMLRSYAISTAAHSNSKCINELNETLVILSAVKTMTILFVSTVCTVTGQDIVFIACHMIVHMMLTSLFSQCTGS